MKVDQNLEPSLCKFFKGYLTGFRWILSKIWTKSCTNLGILEAKSTILMDFEKFLIFPIIGSVSDSKTTVSGRVTGLLLGRLDSISIIFMKNKIFREKNVFGIFFFEIEILKFLKCE